MPFSAKDAKNCDVSRVTQNRLAAVSCVYTRPSLYLIFRVSNRATSEECKNTKKQLLPLIIIAGVQTDDMKSPALCYKLVQHHRRDRKTLTDDRQMKG